ncbi:MAG TPA: Dps family protein [Coleofasciculaceae cyanobacterium]|jgi:starvation-inducible DNA-binding protein
MLTQQAVPINIGISEQDRRHIVEGLERLMADSFLLYLKTLYFHWNVTGPMFQPLHQVFEEQYQQLLIAVDDTAERIRALGSPAPGTFQQFNRLASITETTSVPDSDTMLKLLVEGHEAVIRIIRQVISAAKQADDEATLDMLTSRIDAHEKTAWMLRSFLKPE